jgi:hypothetical protein
LVDQVFLDTGVPFQNMCDKHFGKRWLVMKHTRKSSAFCSLIVTHSVIVVAVAKRFDWPIKQPSPKKTSAPRIATTASFPRSETTVTLTLPFLT